MRDRDAAPVSAIPEVTAILGDALVDLLFPDPARLQVDLPDSILRCRICPWMPQTPASY